jgi:hypothetical protein
LKFLGKPASNESKPNEANNSSNLCNFGNRDSCISITKLAYINSIPGLEVRFQLQGGSKASAMYLSSYMKDCLDWDLLNCTCYQWSSDWHEAGKVLTISLVTQTTPNGVSNGERGVISGPVEYNRQILSSKHNSMKSCYTGPSWYVYPRYIGGLQYITVIGQYNNHDTPPSNAFGPIGGNVEIDFGQYGATSNDEKTGLFTAITFCAVGWESCANLNIHVYSAGRHDNQYITPIEVVNDISGKGYNWYYWWFKDNNPMTYEVEFYGSS